MPHSPEDLFAHLDQLGIVTQTTDHAPVFTVEESRELQERTAGAHTKNLFLRDNKKTYFLVTVEQDRTIDLKRLRSLIGARGGLSFASPEALFEHLGVRPGSVSPFAALNDEAGLVKVYLDEALIEAPLVNCHPLVNTKTTSIAPSDLRRFLASTGHDVALLSLADEAIDQALA
ncbi:prolyl-tRNA synthetase associated domain-containing protein [Lichenifustis flavocetrariae]|uniref:Prolyl-tRNA synthetase associated domain-containing protein n=1 Tax=Lichenifustis flavocetrariae TaxID=2949735 RepID=A0AA41YUX8_9HYPH|nr:prolyl-tRNA synthetase associated domain-containing protein [Lichenifustis flavocetrariae]MCW6507522.1 prolyl-tRNA synthetase associated domain-containing protein [Lichenifustis flavocetrariae]